MQSRKGFTLIELMIVVVIVGILAAIVVPLLLSRVERAKYSEGKAIAGQIATALRAYVAENGATGTYNLVTNLGFKTAELDAKYFAQTGMTVSGVSLDTTTGLMNYTITLTPITGLGLNSGPLIMVCTNNQTTFTSPPGI
jgi:prepilin-type N-terminal cleavage/methylation domain-containing protein